MPLHMIEGMMLVLGRHAMQHAGYSCTDMMEQLYWDLVYVNFMLYHGC